MENVSALSIIIGRIRRAIVKVVLFLAVILAKKITPTFVIIVLISLLDSSKESVNVRMDYFFLLKAFVQTAASLDAKNAQKIPHKSVKNVLIRMKEGLLSKNVFATLRL